MPLRTLPLALALTAIASSAQQLRIGAIGGIPLSRDIRTGTTIVEGPPTTFATTYYSPRQRPLIGLRLELGFTRTWALEVDAIRRELRAREITLIHPGFQLPNGTTLTEFGPFTRTLTPWEFPVLAKYRFPATRFRPFIAAGPSFRPAGSGTGLTHAGVTGGAGFEFRTPGGFRIEPTLRYTYWGTRRGWEGKGSPQPNQLELLVGIDRASTHPVHAFGQRLSLGFIAGLGLGRDFVPGRFDLGHIPERNNAFFGVMAEVPLARGWSVEVDGLYRPLHGTAPEFGRRVRFAHLTWEFPVLAKYRFARLARYTPFAEAGPSFRAEGNLNLRPVSHFGGTLGGGVETRLSWLRIAPTIRYTRWGGDADTDISRTRQNQTQLLISFSF